MPAFGGVIKSLGSARGLVLTAGGGVVLTVTGGRLTIIGFLGWEPRKPSLGRTGWPEDPGQLVPLCLLSVLGLRAAIPIPLGFEVVPRLVVEGVIRVTFGPWPGRFCACVLFGEEDGAPLLNPGLVVTFPGFAVPWLSALNPCPPPRAEGAPTTPGEGTRWSPILPP